MTAADKSRTQNRPVTAALKRCATQNQERSRGFPQAGGMAMISYSESARLFPLFSKPSFS